MAEPWTCHEGREGCVSNREMRSFWRGPPPCQIPPKPGEPLAPAFAPVPPSSFGEAGSVAARLDSITVGLCSQVCCPYCP